MLTVSYISLKQINGLFARKIFSVLETTPTAWLYTNSTRGRRDQAIHCMTVLVANACQTVSRRGGVMWNESLSFTVNRTTVQKNSIYSRAVRVRYVHHFGFKGQTHRDVHSMHILKSVRIAQRKPPPFTLLRFHLTRIIHGIWRDIVNNWRRLLISRPHKNHLTWSTAVGHVDLLRTT
jgi:hypothetical protein